MSIINRKQSANNLDPHNYSTKYEKAAKLKQLGFTTNWNVNDHKKDYNALQDPHANRYFRYQSVKVHIKQLKKSLEKSQITDNQKKVMKKLIKQKLNDHLPAIKLAAQTYNIRKQDINYLDKSSSNAGLNKQKSISEIGLKKLKKHRSKKKKRFNISESKNNLSVQVEQKFILDETNQHKEELQINKDEAQIKQPTGIVQPKQDKAQNNKQTKKSVSNLSVKKDQTKTQLSMNERKVSITKQDQRQGYLKKQKQLLHRKKHQQFISFIAKKRQLLASPSLN